MKSIPSKSRLRYMAHNPTGELVFILSKEAKTYCYKHKQKYVKKLN